MLEPAARSGAEGVAHALATGDMRATREWLKSDGCDVNGLLPQTSISQLSFDMKASTRTASPLSIAAAHGAGDSRRDRQGRRPGS